MKRGGKGPEEAALDDFAAVRRDVARAAIDVTDTLLDAAARKLDALFGAGYAKANPELVGAYLAAASATFREDFATVTDFDGLDLDELDLPLPDLDRRR